MFQLPDELVLLVLGYLTVDELKLCQRLSRRFLTLARDTALWKEICFDSSQAEQARRRWQTELNNDDSRIFIDRSRYRHNWDPGYPDENVDYYEEYIHQNAPINIVWESMPSYEAKKGMQQELTGLALLGPSHSDRNYAVCAIDDGSVAMYNLCSATSSEQIVGHSGPGLISTSPGTGHGTTATNVIESVSVDHTQNRGYFAVDRVLHEIDLNKLSLLSSKQFDSPISVLSTMSPQQPLLVGTESTVHIYDSRERDTTSYSDVDVRIGLDHRILCNQHHVTLPESGPSSVLLAPDNDTIWVAGRFKSLLQYSLRFFPRLKSSVFSGGHISCLTSYVNPHMGRQWDLVDNPSLSLSAHAARKSMPGWTVIGTGVYRGKGSLELYTKTSESLVYERFINRQSASSSKLLSVAMHGSKIVYSDGNAQLTWMNRNGYSPQRTYRIGSNTVQPPSEPQQQQQHAENRESNPLLGLWESIEDNAATVGDIVQKIIPYLGPVTSSGRRPENLLLWNGDGKLGFLGFGSIDAVQTEDFYDALETQAQTAADKAHHDAERQYAMAMRRALQRNADEVRFMRGLGMGAV